jgi:chromosome transmission fidelity protein 1
VPNGVVVAFSTYELMQKCMDQCIGLKKSVFYEAKNENVDKIYSKYSEAARSSKGAFLFIVMKGKFSEGINFNDELCRCLIVVGIPFLPPNDYKVIRKKSYL